MNLLRLCTTDKASVKSKLMLAAAIDEFRFYLLGVMALRSDCTVCFLFLNPFVSFKENRMFSLNRLIISFFLCAISAGASANEGYYASYGSGAAYTCKVHLEMANSNDLINRDGYHQVNQWILGYLSGVSNYGRIEMPNGYGSRVVKRVEEYCKMHPNTKIIKALEEILNKDIAR
jgi:hypothetical protein